MSRFPDFTVIQNGGGLGIDFANTASGPNPALEVLDPGDEAAKGERKMTRKRSLKTLGIGEHNDRMWAVEFHEDFLPEFREFPSQVKKELAARVERLRELGPLLGRPHVDSLNGSEHKNMKELRFEAEGGVWRIAFAFDPRRHAVLLVGRDKSGIGKDRFYKSLVDIADQRFARHLAKLHAVKQERQRNK